MRHETNDIIGIPTRRKPSLRPRPDEIEPLVEHLIFSPLPGCGELIGYAAVKLHRLPTDLVLRGWPVFQVAGGEIKIGMPLVLGGHPGSRFAALSGPEMSQLPAEIRALLAQHPELIQGA